MKKKILVLLVIFAIVGGLVSAQNIKANAWNQIYSETAMREAGAGAPTIFWGFRERIHGSVSADNWGADVRVQALANSRDLHWNQYYGTGTGDWSCNVTLAYAAHTYKVWWAPINGITLTLGNEQYKTAAPATVFNAAYGNAVYMGALAGARGYSWVERTADYGGEWWNKNIAGAENIVTATQSIAQYANLGATLEVTAVPNLKLGLHIPAQDSIFDGRNVDSWANGTISWTTTSVANQGGISGVGTYVQTGTGTKVLGYDHGRDFVFKLNALAEYKLLDDKLTISGIYKGGLDPVSANAAQMGTYVMFDTGSMKISGGWSGMLTERGNANWGKADLMGTNRSSDTNYKYEGGLMWGGTMVSMIDLAAQMKLNNGMTISAAGEVGLNYRYNQLPVLVAVNVAMPNIIDAVSFNLRTTWENVAYVGGVKGTRATLDSGNINLPFTGTEEYDLAEEFTSFYGKIALNPNFTYKTGKHTFDAGAKVWFDYYAWKHKANGAAYYSTGNLGGTHIGYCVPVAYQYNF